MDFPMMRLPTVIGHRGARAHAPENSLAAIAEAADQGAAWIEVDVKLSRDGIPLLMHDEILSTTTDGIGSVADRDFADLATLDTLAKFRARYPTAGAAFVARHGEAPVRVPSLAQALRLTLERGLGINIELKPCPGREVETAEAGIAVALEGWPKPLPPPLISSFSLPCLDVARRIAPDWPRGLLLDGIRPDWRFLARRVEAASINVNGARLARHRLDALLGFGVPILAWTVNRPEQARKLLRWGTSGIFTDHPALMLDALSC